MITVVIYQHPASLAPKLHLSSHGGMNRNERPLSTLGSAGLDIPNLEKMSEEESGDVELSVPFHTAWKVVRRCIFLRAPNSKEAKGVLFGMCWKPP